jgi:transglutaminase/protease-like cytokinesis protein 3
MKTLIIVLLILLPTTAHASEPKADAIVYNEAKLYEHLSEQAQVEAVNDFIARNTEYDYTGAYNDMISAVLLNKSMCMGYTETARLFFDHLGITNNICFGIVDGETHTWNAVRIQKRFYYLDATFNDIGNTNIHTLTFIKRCDYMVYLYKWRY